MTTLSDFVNSGASNQAQVDANTNAIKLLAGRNKIINGHMVIAQRGTSFAAVGNAAYTLDRWLAAYGNSAVRTISQDADFPLSMGTRLNSLKYLITTADTSIGAGEYELLIQVVEGHNVRQFIGRTFTLSFWVKASKAGIYSVSFRNTAADNSYVGEYTINAINTWEKKSITVVGGIPASLVTDVGTGAGLRVGFCLACGTTLATTPNSWKPAGYYGSVNQVNLLDTVNATFFLTGVQLELGEQSTEFEIRSISDEILTCQRYYCTSVPGFKQFLYKKLSWGTNVVRFPVQMRAAPIVSPLNLSALGDTAGAAIAYSAAGFCYTFTNGNEGSVEFNWTANAEL